LSLRKNYSRRVGDKLKHIGQTHYSQKTFQTKRTLKKRAISTSIYSLRVSQQVQSMVLMQVPNSMAQVAELERESESRQVRSQTSIARLNASH
jgi:hypothetical protein